MNAFNWLHLTDLHFGLGGQAPLWPNVRDVFFDDLSRLHERSGPWDAVLFTGDMVQKGAKGEFDQLTEKVLVPLWNHLESLGSGKAVLLTVPGNHDLSRPDSKKPSAALRQLLRKDGFREIADEFWSDPSSEYRGIITNAFKNYCDWTSTGFQRNGVTISDGILPGDFAATIPVQGSGGKTHRIGVAGINTTFLQLAEGDFTGRLVWSESQIHLACGGDLPAWAKSHDVCLLMTHQGPSWLDGHSNEHAYPEIYPGGRFAVHLFGHMHETALRSMSVGAGKPVRHWQGRSIFGLEKFGDPPVIDRRHGYCIGRIEFTAEGATIRQWPRRAIRDASGWRFEPDHESCVLVEADNGTESELIAKHQSANQPKNNARSKATSHRTVGVGAPVLGSLWAWPHNDPKFAEYCKAVCKAHSHIRFVEIPHLKDVSDVELDSLYVEPKLSSQEIHPDLPPSNWPRCSEALNALNENKHLVLLGDPGSGKSTLVSCIAWQLCRPQLNELNTWGSKFGGLIPLPMILRELKLRADISWEGLLDAFLEHRIGKLLQDRATIESLLTNGRAIVLLDGLDEVGNLTVRRKLKDAVHAGISSYPNSRWILTSRVVGYESVPFHFRTEDIASDAETSAEVVEVRKKTKRVRIPVTSLLFLAPFDDPQIGRFASNWYAQHEREKDIVQQSAGEFVTAIQANEGTQRLARIPYLLTLMALIHHKNARLPHGRTELYDRIATAYLESIDLRRQLDQLPYSLAQKKRWLAEVAYRMQLRRSKSSHEENQGDILASKTEVERWLKSAMTESSSGNSAEEVTALLDYFAKRSGLLLPRGEGKFAFMHLSLQEYFAACFLEPRLTASRFAPVQKKAEPSDETLRSWANEETWREAFILLFELISEKSKGETEGFLNHLFKSRLGRDRDGTEATAAGLLAELATDPFVVLSVETRRRCRQDAWRWIFRQKSNSRRRLGFNPSRNNIIRSLLRESQGDIQKAWKAASLSKAELNEVEILDLSACADLCDITPLGSLPKLKHLSLRECHSVQELLTLGKLKELQFLDLQGCAQPATVQSGLKVLKRIEVLFLGAPVELASLTHLNGLKELHLHYDGSDETDLTPLAMLAGLKLVCLGRKTGKFNIDPELREAPDKILSSGVRRLFEVVARHLPTELRSADTARSKMPKSPRRK